MNLSCGTYFSIIGRLALSNEGRGIINGEENNMVYTLRENESVK